MDAGQVKQRTEYLILLCAWMVYGFLAGTRAIPWLLQTIVGLVMGVYTAIIVGDR